MLCHAMSYHDSRDAAFKALTCVRNDCRSLYSKTPCTLRRMSTGSRADCFSTCACITSPKTCSKQASMSV